MSCVPGELALAAVDDAPDGGEGNGGKGAGGGGLGWYPRCEAGQLLPCFLQFADYDIPRSDASNMRCFPVVRKPPALVLADCDGAAAGGALDDAVDIASQSWELSPSYYQYSGCRCLSGFSEIWSRNGTRLRCVVQSRGAALPPWAWVFVALGVVLALLAAAIALVGSRWVLFRSRWAREAELKRKRAKGPPKGGGSVAIVVTDIEGYSGARRCARCHAAGAAQRAPPQRMPSPTHTHTRHRMQS